MWRCARSTRLGFLKRRTESMSVSPCLDMYSIVSSVDANEIILPTNIQLNNENVETPTLLDSGAGGIFLDQNYARKLKVKEIMLTTPIVARNVDGTPNKKGTIRSYVNLQFKIGDKSFYERFYITGLGKQKMILGLPWLKRHNPLVDWTKGTLTWQTDKPREFSIKKMLLGRKKYEELEREQQPKINIFETDNSEQTNDTTPAHKLLVEEWNNWRNKSKDNKPTTDNTTPSRQDQQPTIEEVPDEEEQKNHTTTPIEEDRNEIFLELLETDTNDTDIWINAKTNLAMDLAIDVNLKKAEPKPEELVPKESHESRKFSIESRTPNTSLNLTFDGATTMFRSERKTNGKLLSRPTED